MPFVENIHQKVLEAVTEKGKLKMDTWHGDEAINDEGEYCGTTHCWAGWTVALAGKAGRELEAQTSTEFAAKQIMYKSNPNIRVSPVRFYESNELAMKNIEDCANKEKELNDKK